MKLVCSTAIVLFCAKDFNARFTYAAVFCDLPIRSRIWNRVLYYRNRCPAGGDNAGHSALGS